MTELIRLAHPDTGMDEVEAIASVLRSGVLTNGPQTVEFEREFARVHEVEHAVAFANGTVALAAMLLAADIGVGDEVIVPSMTFISTATSVNHVGATPRFADVRPDIFNLDPADVARRITKRTKAILPVHYGGQPADMQDFRDLADAAGVVLLEDAAEAHGAKYKGQPVGGLGDAAMFSFTPTKNITTGEGGIVTTRNAEWANKLRLLRNHGQSTLYRHVSIGYNWRLTEMQAAMGIVQLHKLYRILERKQANADWLREQLSGSTQLAPPVVLQDRTHAYMLYTLRVMGDNRDTILESLLDHQIEARIYFPPAHLQPVYSHYRTSLPVTEDLAGRVVSIPFHSRLTSADLERMAGVLKQVLPAPPPVNVAGYTKGAHLI